MIPILLLLGLGAAFAAYELSPRAHARVDEFAHAFRQAYEAHREADAHLTNAGMARDVAAQHTRAAAEAQQQVPQPPPPVVTQPPQAAPAPPPPAQIEAAGHADAASVAATAGVDHAVAANTANQKADQKTTEALQKAKTENEKQAAAQSAAKVIERQQKIDAVMTSLGVGQCGVRSYPGVTAQKRDALLARLHAEGMDVTGNNPWNIETHQAEVKLRAAWDPKAQVLKLIVVSSADWAPCAVIWTRIEPKLREVLGVS
jgi:hypothetical protein